MQSQNSVPVSQYISSQLGVYLPVCSLGFDILKDTFSLLSFIYLFIYLFMAALGLHCCAQAFSSCGEWELLFIVVHGLLIAVASLVVEHRL